MGIKDLNRFLKDKCSESIRCVSMSDLSGKKIAVDISIYLYKYIGDDTLIENLYLMFSIFKFYNIMPIFIFDGKPPTEKKDLIKQRKDDKLYAKNEYNRLKDCLTSCVDDYDKQEITATMDTLKKQFVYITKQHIQITKELIKSFGMCYYDAPGEADELCAMLVIKKRVWACLSEDMDMFVYGCPRVLRYFSLINHNAVLYKMKYILQDLAINQKEFREMCVLSGTDYNNLNNSDNGPTFQKTTKLFKKYKKSNENISFYEWIQKNVENYIADYDLLKNIYSIFDLANNEQLKICDKIRVTISNIDSEKMRIILKEDGFIFPPNNGLIYQRD
jgi:flap endonuclease-1